MVLRHGNADLETFVLAVEARPGVVDPAPEPPLVAPLLGPGHWCLQPGLELATVMGRQLGDPVVCRLRWRPEPGIALELVRRYGANGLLEPLTGA